MRGKKSQLNQVGQKKRSFLRLAKSFFFFAKTQAKKILFVRPILHRFAAQTKWDPANTTTKEENGVGNGTSA